MPDWIISAGKYWNLILENAIKPALRKAIGKKICALSIFSIISIGCLFMKDEKCQI